ncbi:hypothetical protein BU15DRAFT_81083 [Melanogaster broomeanus]|nr:hypothetical protein BU15DRAFT_81083 [Melanogaster broomeanus]
MSRDPDAKIIRTGLAMESTSAAERTAHSYSGSLYLLPSDEEERQRYCSSSLVCIFYSTYNQTLGTASTVYQAFLGSLIFLPVTFAGKEEILDIGTGAGAWLCDLFGSLGERSSICLFCDQSSPLLELKVRTSPSTSPHMRIHRGEQWIQVAKEMYRVLAPGGYAQLIEIGPEWVSGPKTATHSLFIDDLLGRKGMLFRCGVYIADILKNAGFVDVKSEDVVMKLGKWAGQDGVLGRDVTIGAWRGMRDATMRAGGLGYFSTAEEFDKALDEIEEEWDSVEGSYTTLKVFYGRKP